MSFSRLNYDDDSYKHQLRESIGPAEYMLGTPATGCRPCFPVDPSIPMGTFGAGVCTDKNLIDVDSELMGITRKDSKCPTNKYLPSEQPFCNAVLPRECPQLSSEDTRLSNPPCTLRCRGWNRWEFLCKNPQDMAIPSFDMNINNRLVVKDNHRPCVARPIDPASSLPDPKNANIVYDWSSKYVQSARDVPSPALASCQNMRSL